MRSLLLGYWDSGAVSTALFDGADDPLVSFAEWGEGEPFSDFAWNRVWSRMTRLTQEVGSVGVWGCWDEFRDPVPSGFPLLRAEDSTFGPRDVKYLAGCFAEGPHTLVSGRWRETRRPTTGEPLRLFAPSSVLRYFGPSVRVQVICKGNPAKGTVEAHWDGSADSAEALADAVRRHLWQHRGLSRTLKPATEAGRAALDLIRRGSRRK
jgi:hypothetical protein